MNSHTRYCCILAGTLLLVCPAARGQYLASADTHNVSSGLFVSPDSAEPSDETDFPILSGSLTLEDSVRQHTPRLLPDGLSPLESVLWGEHGLMRTTGISPLTPQSRMKELKVRRFMLTAHQIGGYVTLGLLIPTIIQGQKTLQNWNDVTAGRRPYSRSINRTHKSLAQWTFISYMTTASFALFSPPPLIRRGDWDTIKWHKTLAWVHFTGMLALPILGYLAFHAKTAREAKTLRVVHAVTGYTTAAAFSLSMIILTF